MVIWYEFRMRQYRDFDHQEDALQFTIKIIGENLYLTLTGQTQI